MTGSKQTKSDELSFTVTKRTPRKIGTAEKAYAIYSFLSPTSKSQVDFKDLLFFKWKELKLGFLPFGRVIPVSSPNSPNVC